MYDEEGNLVTGTLADYLVPGAAELPPKRCCGSRAAARGARTEVFAIGA